MLGARINKIFVKMSGLTVMLGLIELQKKKNTQSNKNISVFPVFVKVQEKY